MDVLSIILLLVVGYLAYKMFAPTKGVKQVSTTELKPLLNDRKRFYLDVRTPAEFKGNHIKGFKNIPLQTLNSQLNQIPKDKEVLVICQSDAKQTSHQSIKKAGYTDVTEVRGGMNAWR